MIDLLVPLSLSFGIKFMWDILNYDSIRLKFKRLELENYKIKQVTKKDYGHELIIEVLEGGSFEELENMTPIFNKMYSCKTYVYNVEYTNKVRADLVHKVKDISYIKKSIPSTQLIVGYNYKLEPITINMKITPHVGVVGLSNNGKTKCIEQMLNNLDNVTIDIVNAMENDYKYIKGNRINGEDNIIDYFYYLTHGEEVFSEPHYVVIDEYNLLSHIKGIEDIISDLLRQARHRNIYIILIAQQLQLEYCSFRDLFNTRICFRQLNKQAIYSFLGQTVENTNLKQREFILLHQKLEYGKTYVIKC